MAPSGDDQGRADRNYDKGSKDTSNYATSIATVCLLVIAALSERDGNLWIAVWFVVVDICRSGTIIAKVAVLSRFGAVILVTAIDAKDVSARLQNRGVSRCSCERSKGSQRGDNVWCTTKICEREGKSE